MMRKPRVNIALKIYSVSASQGSRLLRQLLNFARALRCPRAGWRTGIMPTTQKPWKKAKVRDVRRKR